MEEVRPARRSSYDINSGSDLSIHSRASLRGHAVLPAGSRFSEGEINRTTPGGVAARGIGYGVQPDTTARTTADAPPAAHVPFYKKRKFIISQIILIPLAIALLFILLFPVVRAIVELVVKRTTLEITGAAISSPQNNTFDLQLQGNVLHAGIINAKIEFTEPVAVSWVANDSQAPIPIGTMTMSPLSVKHKRAVINTTTNFVITDQDAFGRFSSALITQKNFTWQLESHNLRVQALKFPVSKGITFLKRVTVNGFDNFNGNVVLSDLQLPSDNPAGGINFVAATELNNPSPFTLTLGTVVFELFYKNVSLGLGTGFDTIIVPGSNRITLSGVLQPQTTPNNLAAVSELFTNYLNGDNSPVIATGKSTLQTDNSTISWLSAGLQALNLNVPFKAPSAINPIRTISIGEFALAFSDDHPWAPAVTSNTVQASLLLPFGFNVAIGQIENDFNITVNGSPVAGLSTPLGASTSSIKVLSSTDTEGAINITIDNTRLSSSPSQHPDFALFNAELTDLATANFRLVGQSRAVANMSIGQITLSGIKVDVPTSLQGLKGLKGLTTIESVDVQGGTTDGITLGIQVNIFNPSNLQLDTGDLTLQLSRDGAVLGTALLPNLTLAMGNNSLLAKSTFEANKTPQGLQTLNDFVGKKDVQLSISGFDGSTKIVELVQAFNTLNMGVVLPGLNTSLLDTAALEVLSTTGRSNDVAHVTVSLTNPFTAALRITQITSTVSSFGIPLGTINATTDFDSAPKTTTKSPTLDLNMNFDPSSLFTVTRALAVEAGLDVAPLDAITSIGGIPYLKITGPAPAPQRRQANLFKGFDLPTFVQTAFKKLQSDVELTTAVTIGDYQTTLQYTQSSVPTLTDDSLNFILPVLAQPIVQKIVTGSSLGIDTVLITDPQQNSFGTTLTGSISNAGPFDAVISFPSGLQVNWNGKPLGNIQMGPVSVVGDVGGAIKGQSTFSVADVGHLTDFTKVLLTEESFEWDISGEGLTVNALGINVTGVSLPSKKITLKGFNGLQGGVKILSFDLPSNDPAGGIHLTLQATAENPSQVGVELSNIGFETFVGDIMIAPVNGGPVTLAPGVTSPLALVGRLVPQSSPAGLSTVSDVFNNFIHGKDSDVVVHGASAGPSGVTWLNEGIKSLQVSTVLPNRGSLDLIKSIDLNQLQILFTQGTAYNPSTSSQSTDAAFTLPFDFPLGISALQQTITVGFQGTSFAQLALPKGPTTTDVQNRIIHITFDNVPFAVFENTRPIFDQFVAATTTGGTQTLHLSGSANADAQTAVGLLSLTDISFSVDSSIAGLQGLASRPVTISNLDVNHGFSDFLLIKVDSALFNPSNLTIGTGDVAFNLQFQDQTIGTADISNLVIKPGNGSYPIDVHFAPQGGAVAAGRTLLQNFIQGIDVDTAILGSQDSTPINSLKTALSEIHLSPVTIPAIQQNLLKSASLSFPLNIVQTGVAATSFVLSNPFTASINLLKLGAVATFHGMTVGTINNIDISAHPIRADGHSDVTSPTLPISFNLDPLAIIGLLTASAQINGVDLGPLAQLFQFVVANPGFRPPVTTSVDTSAPTCVSGNQFDATGAILRALSGLKVDLAVQSSVKLDDFATDLTFNQKGVPAITDRTALFLIGAVAGPISQHLVDGSVLKIDSVLITGIDEDGFDLALSGSLTDIGPLDALITFVEPATVEFQGSIIGQIALPPICAAANTGVPNYKANARFVITDQAKFTSFATFLLHNPSFDWIISTPKLRLNALGTIFDNVVLTKTITLKAFNGLPGVTINDFTLPSDDPAGGIHIVTGSAIPSSAQVGIDLGTVTFDSFFQGTHVGPLSTDHLILPPSSTTNTQLTGRIVPQSGQDLVNIGTLFSNFLAGKNQTLIVKGQSVQPSGASQPVSWLTAAFQTLSLEVTLPGQQFDVIQSIQISDLSVTIETQEQAFAPPASSQFTLATYKNPFGFSLQVVEAGETLILNSHGVDIAQLVLPKVASVGGVSTGNIADLVISFKNQALVSLNNAAFPVLFAQVTLLSSVDVTLKGTADVTARTSIGDVGIAGIPFNVASSLPGINSFGNTASLSNVTVTGSGGVGGSEFIVAPLTTTLNNPSNISLQTTDVQLPVVFNGVTVGRAAIDPFNLVPGQNDIATEFHYEPADANDTVAQGFLVQFIQSNQNIPLTIHGDAASTPFGSLQQALAGLQLTTQLAALNQPTFITHINVFISLESLDTNLVDAEFTVTNPLDVDLVIEFVQTDAGVNGEIFAQFSEPFDGFIVPPGQVVSSGRFSNVLLTQGAIASLDIIPLGFLDVSAPTTVRVGQGGYEIPFLKLQQPGVPTDYTLDLGFDAAAKKVVQGLGAAKGSKGTTATTTTAKEVHSASGSASSSSSESPKPSAPAAASAIPSEGSSSGDATKSGNAAPQDQSSASNDNSTASA